MAANPASLLGLTAEMVAAYAGNNAVSPGELPDVIRTVHATLRQLNQPAAAAAEPEALVPAVPIRKSVHPDFNICLEDGKKLKMLKRHLMTHYGLSPEDYRARWGLPRDYPMVAPDYAKSRADTARRLGLGRRRSEGDGESA